MEPDIILSLQSQFNMIMLGILALGATTIGTGVAVFFFQNKKMESMKDDIHKLESKMERLESKVDVGFQQLRNEMQLEFSNVRSEMQQLRSEMQLGFKELGGKYELLENKVDTQTEVTNQRVTNIEKSTNVQAKTILQRLGDTIQRVVRLEDNSRERSASKVLQPAL